MSSYFETSNEPLHFTLMSRQHEVACGEFDRTRGEFAQVKILDELRAPLALVTFIAERNLNRAFNQWWTGRGIPNKRKGLFERVSELDIQFLFELAFAAHGLCLSDQYWLSFEGEKLRWEDINFFTNDFDLSSPDTRPNFKTSAGIWMEGVGLNNPDAATDGMLDKRWFIDGRGRRVLYKASGESGREVHNEVLASMLCRHILPAGSFVEYQPLTWHDQEVAMCENFLQDNEEYIPALQVIQLTEKPQDISNFEHYCTTCRNLGVDDIEAHLSHMIVCDSILANSDRHWGNFGLIRNMETLEYRVAPLFDMGTSLWSSVPISELAKGKYHFESGPFARDPRDQLKLVGDRSWYSKDAAKAFLEEAESYLARAYMFGRSGRVLLKGLATRLEAM